MEQTERPFTAVSVTRAVHAEIQQISAATNQSKMRVVAAAIAAYAKTAKIRKALEKGSAPALEVRA